MQCIRLTGLQIHQEENNGRPNRIFLLAVLFACATVYYVVNKDEYIGLMDLTRQKQVVK